MDTADNRNYGLPRRGHERLFKDRLEVGSIIWRFTRGTVPKERGTAKSSIPFPRSNRREKEAHPFLPFFFRSSSSPSCYNHVTNSRLRLSRFYRPNIPTDALSFHDIDIKYGFTSMDFTFFFIFLYRILEFYYPKSNNFNFLNNNQELLSFLPYRKNISGDSYWNPSLNFLPCILFRRNDIFY